MTDDNIKIIAFGKEKPDFNTMQAIKKILLFYPTNINSVLVESMAYIYCNSECPQNNCIKFTSLNAGIGGIYINGRFAQWRRERIFKRLKDVTYKRIIQCIKLFKNHIPQYIEPLLYEQYERLMCNKCNIRSLYKDFALVLHNFHLYLENIKQEGLLKEMQD